jgi:hypothetical protein
MTTATDLTAIPAICPTCGYRVYIEVAENGSVALDVCEHLDPDPEPDPAGAALLVPDWEAGAWTMDAYDLCDWARAA